MTIVRACGAALLLSSLAMAQDAPRKARVCDTVTGPITFKEKESRRIGIRNPDGRIRTFTVDSVAMPKWFEEFQVGARITATCKDAGDEHRPIATSLKAAPEEAPKGS